MGTVIGLWWIWLIGTVVFGGWAFLGAAALFFSALSRGGRGGADVRVPGTKAAFVLGAASAALLAACGIHALVT